MIKTTRQPVHRSSLQTVVRIALSSAMSGTIRQISNKPNLSEVEGKVEAGVSTIAHGSTGYTFKGLINAPVVEDTFAIRASAYYIDFGGYLDNIAT